MLMVKPSIHFFALTFAILKIGAIMICIDPGMGLKNTKKCLAESDPDAFIGIPKAHLARYLFRWPRCKKYIVVDDKNCDLKLKDGFKFKY